MAKLIVMEHNTIKKILIGLIFCIVLFALSFLLEEKSKTANPSNEGPGTQMVTEPPDAEN